MGDTPTEGLSGADEVPRRMPSNGVPWLEWVGHDRWECRGCGGAGELPPLRTVAEFARLLGDLNRRHFLCRSPDDGNRRPGVGHPRNPDRVERG